MLDNFISKDTDCVFIIARKKPGGIFTLIYLQKTGAMTPLATSVRIGY